MRSIGEIIKHQSGQMNDQQWQREYARWTRPMWLEYMNEGLAEIGAYRPEAFSAIVPIPLVTGSTQALPAGVSGLTGITDNGSGLAAREASAALAEAFSAYAVCKPYVKYVNGAPVYSVSSYYADTRNARAFYVQPPVPAWASITIQASVNKDAPQYTLADWNTTPDIDSKFYNNLLDFMQARAYGLDSESAVSLSESKKLFSLFYQAMGVKYKIDSAYKSGYYLGQIGEGDPRARV